MPFCLSHLAEESRGAMGLHSFDQARARGFTAMQFNFVISSTNALSGYGRASVLQSWDGFRVLSGIHAWARWTLM
jgi:hypothetical protein